MKNMKIKIESPEHSEEVQKALFELGYSWGLTRVKRFKYTFSPYLFTMEGLYLTRTDDAEYFELSESEQYWLHLDGGFYNYPPTKETEDDIPEQFIEECQEAMQEVENGEATPYERNTKRKALGDAFNSPLQAVAFTDDLFEYVAESGNCIKMWNAKGSVNFTCGHPDSTEIHAGGQKELADIITSFYNKKSKRDRLIDEMLGYANKVEELKNQIEEMDNE